MWPQNRQAYMDHYKGGKGGGKYGAPPGHEPPMPMQPSFPPLDPNYLGLVPYQGQQFNPGEDGFYS